MKQRINKKQWNEISEEHKEIFLNSPYIIIDKTDLPTIGQMIELLGEDWFSIYKKPGFNWMINWGKGEEDIDRSSAKKEIVDVLWEMVKYKLNN